MGIPGGRVCVKYFLTSRFPRIFLRREDFMEKT